MPKIALPLALAGSAVRAQEAAAQDGSPAGAMEGVNHSTMEAPWVASWPPWTR